MLLRTDASSHPRRAAPEALLASNVPQLEPDLDAINVDVLHGKVDPDRCLAVLAEVIIHIPVWGSRSVSPEEELHKK